MPGTNTEGFANGDVVIVNNEGNSYEKDCIIIQTEKKTLEESLGSLEHFINYLRSLIKK